jgi:hypothetical protein
MSRRTALLGISRQGQSRLATPPPQGQRGDFMRHLASLSSIFLLIACNTNAVPRTQSNELRTVQGAASKDTPLQFLLNAAAADFHAHLPSRTIHFRKVHIGHVVTPNGEKQYILCGQLQTARAEDKAEWTPFVTINTSGYEQWLGDQAASFCKRPSIVWEKGDRSTSLQSRFDSLP